MNDLQQARPSAGLVVFEVANWLQLFPKFHAAAHLAKLLTRTDLHL
jgi:hypothetical protein